MKNFRKAICLLASCGMLVSGVLPTLTSCSSGTASGGADESQNKTENTAESNIETTAFIPASYLPEVSYDGREINILAAAEQWIKTYDSEQSGDILDDAVYNRNRSVSERFNVKLNYHKYNGYSAGMNDVKAALSGAVLGGTNEFDLLAADGYYVGDYVFDGLLAVLDGLDAFDFSREHWMTDTILEHRLNGKTYFAAGYWSMNTIKMIITLFYNRDIAASYSLDDIYALVNDGKWTTERFIELAKQVSSDTNGNGSMDKEDLWGLVTSGVDTVCPMQTAMGYSYTTTENGTLELAGINERLTVINEKLYDILHNNEYALITNEAVNSSDIGNNVMISKFTGGSALFMLYRLDMAELQPFREMENYGLLPLPKYDEAQESYIGSGGCDIAAIPAVVSDSQMSAVICDALSAYGYYDVLPVYYDVVLTEKYARDENSVKMLDLITKNVYTDPAVTFSKILDSIYYSIGGSKDIASTYEKKLDTLREKLAKSLETLG